MAKQKEIIVKDTTIRSFSQNGWDYICITDIARQKNAIEPKDVVKNWMRLKNTIEYLGMWEALNNPLFKGVEFDPLLREAGSNAFTLSPSRWIEFSYRIFLTAFLRCWCQCSVFILSIYACFLHSLTQSFAGWLKSYIALRKRAAIIPSLRNNAYSSC